MERLGDEVARSLARSGSGDAVPLTAVTAAWPEIVGDAIARRAWPRRVSRDGTLHVATESATWAHELDLLGPEILERLTARLGDEAPAKLRFAVGPVPEPPEVTPQPSRAPASVVDVGPEMAAEASAAASAIDDPELRELAARAARASLLKARSGRCFW